MFVRTEPVHVTGMNLGLSRTPALVAFKQNAGQNNHFLITVLVGLDAVRDGEVKLNPEFSTSWRPKDILRSATRSRQYALITSLAWITDLVDVYRKQVQAMPSVLPEVASAKIKRIDGRARRLAELASALELPRSDRNLQMILFATKWRNTIVHSDADTRLGSDLRSSLLNSAQGISLAHRGLDITRSVASFERGDAPTFKEVASFIAAGQQLVAALDLAVLTKMNVEQYAETTLRQYLTDAFTSNRQVFSQFWPGEPAKSHQRLTNLLTQLGFTRGEPLELLSSDFLTQLSELAAREARERYLLPQRP